MARFRKVDIDFWKGSIIEKMSKEEKDLYLYLFTNHNTTQIGIYRITERQIAYDRADTVENVHSLMKRLISHHKVIRYNSETTEIALKYWGVVNLENGGKPMMDCIFSELKNVSDLSLITYVAEMIPREETRIIFETIYKKETKKAADKSEYHPYADRQSVECDDASASRYTIGGQEEEKEVEKEKEKEKQQHLSFYPKIENKPNHQPFQNIQNDVAEIIAFWDNNGFGFSNINAKQQLLCWLDDSPFLHPREVIVKAMTIACTNNMRRLNYVVAILKHWVNESLLTIEEINAHDEKLNSKRKEKERAEIPAGRYIPRIVDVDMTEGES
jgi:DnaD/phage-associated family protein